ncbi:MAG: nucleotidyltransferase domain-containing protein [Actinomycetota bacterium]|nr:nucleotidyltransferase domain-containing protein [Actinomycetota bacterium]
MVADLVAAVQPARVIVFGSVARGEDSGDSDLDLLVLVEDLTAKDRRRLMSAIRRAIGAPIPIDILVASVSEYEAGKDVNGSPYYWPAREGRVVHERPTA